MSVESWEHDVLSVPGARRRVERLVREFGGTRPVVERGVHWLYVRLLFGKRCRDYEEGCPSCEAWANYEACT